MPSLRAACSLPCSVTTASSTSSWRGLGGRPRCDLAWADQRSMTSSSTSLRHLQPAHRDERGDRVGDPELAVDRGQVVACLLYTSDAADERSSVDLGGRR